jgi:hypothetical protein
MREARQELCVQVGGEVGGDDWRWATGGAVGVGRRKRGGRLGGGTPVGKKTERRRRPPSWLLLVLMGVVRAKRFTHARFVIFGFFEIKKVLVRSTNCTERDLRVSIKKVLGTNCATVSSYELQMIF